MRRTILWITIFVAILAVVTPRTLPWILSIYFPGVTFRLDDNEKTLYLTIDDSPTSSTDEILRVLKKHGVPATFFVIGSRVRSSPSLRDEALVRYGNHFDSTKKFSEMAPQEAVRSFSDADRFIPTLKKSPWYRYPSDLGSDNLRAAVKLVDRYPILGTVYPLDHWLSNETLIRLIIHWMAVPGGIIIMHDGNERGVVTARILDRVIPELKSRGFEFRQLPLSR